MPGTSVAFYTSFVRDSYIYFKPKGQGVVATAGSFTLTIVTAVVIVPAFVLVVALLLVRSRRGPAEEE